MLLQISIINKILLLLGLVAHYREFVDITIQTKVHTYSATIVCVNSTYIVYTI